MNIQLSEALAELRKATLSFVMSLRLSSFYPHVRTPLPLDIIVKMMLEYLLKLSRENSSFVKI
jgi:hypothetical protein